MTELVHTLQIINAARQRGDIDDSAEIDRRFDRPSTRLAVYGSLAPGESNHGIIEDIAGTWNPGFVRGDFLRQGWGTHVGFPGMTGDPKSRNREDLPAHWDRLDDFEGEDPEELGAGRGSNRWPDCGEHLPSSANS